MSRINDRHDAAVARMRLDDVPMTAIMVALGISACTYKAVVKRLLAAGLTQPRHSKRAVSAAEWDVVEATAMEAAGWSEAAIAKRYGITPSAVSIRIALAAGMPPICKPRPCMGCATVFASSGAGHRYCNPCKQRPAWLDGDASMALSGARMRDA